MATQVDPPTSAVASGRAMATSRWYVQGARAGLLGAALLALWFFFLDYSRGKVLYTPTVMGAALFRGGEGLASPEALAPSVALTLGFTVVHGLIFILIGIAGMRLLEFFEAGTNVILGVLVLFAVLGLSFFGFAITFSAVALNALQLRDVLIGNGIAAGGMAGYLLRHYRALADA